MLARYHDIEQSPRYVMSFEYIFLTIVIPEPSNPKHLIVAYLESLIEELLQLWHMGVRAYDNATDKAFIMRAALMWTVNNLPVYGMAFGWSIAGIMGVQFLWMTQGHSICSTIERRATLTATNSFSLRTILTEGTKKSSQKILWNIRLHVEIAIRPESEKTRPGPAPNRRVGVQKIDTGAGSGS
ncbi:UNVERIFIED_CONTAM: hypothetical protein Sradi_5714900 [Sesamum radiatum]|uniref:Uncharacterized protein n=1 Tax=Sesamum radiatum TaxID=300843 RepID=A0AAW2L1M3_SESRA